MRSREYRGRCESSLPRSDPLRVLPVVPISPPRRHLRSTAADYTRWLLGHSHASTTNCMSDQSISLPPPPIAPTQRTESARFALHVLFSIPLPQAVGVLSLTLHHLSLLAGFPRSPSLPSLSLYILRTALHHPARYILVSRVCFRARYYQAWKLRLALFELFATVLIRFIVAAWPRQAA